MSRAKTDAKKLIYKDLIDVMMDAGDGEGDARRVRRFGGWYKLQGEGQGEGEGGSDWVKGTLWRAGLKANERAKMRDVLLPTHVLKEVRECMLALVFWFERHRQRERDREMRCVLLPIHVLKEVHECMFLFCSQP
jgi:hypothetical protein